MTEFERITVSPAVLGAVLSSFPCLEDPWNDAFHREFCSKSGLAKEAVTNG